MTFLRKIFRLSRLIIFLFASVAVTLFYKSEVKDGIPNTRYFIRAQKLMAKLCRILHLNLVVEGQQPERNGLLVSNHISWVDIPVVGAALPSLFLSKAEVKSWPLIGWVAKSNGTVFIARGKQGAADRAKVDLAHTLSHDVNVLLFPEGTTTDGTYLRKFHPRLFAAAIQQDVVIQPLTIRYENANGELNNDIPFIDGQNILDNIWRIVGVKNTTVRVTLLPQIPINGLARKEIAQQAREVIHTALQLPPEN